MGAGVNMSEEKTRKARKEHICDVCLDKVKVGEKYVNFTTTPWDYGENDAFYDIHTHIQCWADWVAGLAEDCDGYFPDDPQIYQEWKNENAQKKELLNEL